MKVPIRIVLISLITFFFAIFLINRFLFFDEAKATSSSTTASTITTTATAITTTDLPNNEIQVPFEFEENEWFFENGTTTSSSPLGCSSFVGPKDDTIIWVIVGVSIFAAVIVLAVLISLCALASLLAQRNGCCCARD